MKRGGREEEERRGREEGKRGGTQHVFGWVAANRFGTSLRDFGRSGRGGGLQWHGVSTEQKFLKIPQA